MMDICMDQEHMSLTRNVSFSRIGPLKDKTSFSTFSTLKIRGKLCSTKFFHEDFQRQFEFRRSK